jgi:hypothetical protein
MHKSNGAPAHNRVIAATRYVLALRDMPPLRRRFASLTSVFAAARRQSRLVT